MALHVYTSTSASARRLLVPIGLVFHGLLYLCLPVETFSRMLRFSASAIRGAFWSSPRVKPLRRPYSRIAARWDSPVATPCDG